jgi:glutathione S-transferase
MIRIHNFARGARGQRVMWLCEEMGLAYSVKNHTYPVGDDYRALNPLGTVPFLEDTGGVAINESIAMMLTIAQGYGPTPLLPVSDPPNYARVLQLTLMGETEIGTTLNPLLAAHFMAGPADKRNWSVKGLEQRLDRAVHFLDTLVAEKPFLVGNDLTLADISVSCGLGIWQGALRGKLPDALNNYQEGLQSRPAYQRARSRCAGE